MKVTLQFDLPEEREELEQTMKADKYYCVLWDLDQQVLRKNIKYNDSLTDEQYKVYEEIRDKLYEIMEEHSITLD